MGSRVKGATWIDICLLFVALLLVGTDGTAARPAKVLPETPEWARISTLAVSHEVAFIADDVFASCEQVAPVGQIAQKVSADAGGSSLSHTRAVIPILMYHYVRVVTNPKDKPGIRLSVTPAQFAKQMQYLADNGYTTLTMDDVYSILLGKMPLPPKPIALTFDDGYRDFYQAAWPVLKAHNFKATSYIITGVVGQKAYMTWDMIRELDATGMVDFGAHTLTHADLSAVKEQRRWNEINGSKVALEGELGHKVTAFCYPSGKYNQATLADVRKAGFLTATTVQSGSKQSLDRAYEMPRIRVTGTDSLKTWEGNLPVVKGRQ